MTRDDRAPAAPPSSGYSHLWDRLRAENPRHSADYAQRWRDLAAEGKDLDGEARFAMALVGPGSRVLDAGCGQGRVGGYLSERGYGVWGVDLDEELVAEARAAYPRADWRLGDLAVFDFRALAAEARVPGRDGGFDLVVSAGNVLTFLDPAARRPALAGLRSALGEGGRLVTGLGLDRGYELDDYLEDLAESGLHVQHRFSSWHMHPFDPASDYLVCVSTAD